MTYILKCLEENKTPSTIATVLGLNCELVNELYVNCNDDFKESERVTDEMLESFLYSHKYILDELLEVHISSYKSNSKLNISKNKLTFIVSGLRENIMPSMLAETINVNYDVIYTIVDYYNKNLNKSNKDIVNELVKKVDIMQQQNKISAKEEAERYNQSIDEEVKEMKDFLEDLFN